jgi:hypothetical protein
MQRIGIKIEANAKLYVVGIATYWRIPRKFLYFTTTDPPPPSANIYRKKERFLLYCSIRSCREAHGASVVLAGGDTDKCMPRNLSIGSYSDDVKVCIGFYLDSYSLVTCRFHRVMKWAKLQSLGRDGRGHILIYDRWSISFKTVSRYYL